MISIQNIDLKQLFDQYSLYRELQSKSVNDEIYLSRLENEIARRSKMYGVDLFLKLKDNDL